jgi:Right handed beta helix region
MSRVLANQDKEAFVHMSVPVLTVPTISDLRKTLGTAGSCVIVLCHTNLRDGGGGTFAWDPTSQLADDNGLTINPNLPAPGEMGGRWIRVWDAALNVRWFGTQGDWNETAQNGTDDYIALCAAAGAINALGSGTLLFPPGTYRIDRYKVISDPARDYPDIVFKNCSGLHVLGYGATISVMGKFHCSADTPIGADNPGQYVSNTRAIQPFVFEHCTNVKIEGFELNGNVEHMTRDPAVADGAGSGITFGSGSSNYMLVNLYVHSFGTDGIYLGQQTPVPPPAPAIADRNAFLYNVKSVRNARDGLSIVSLAGGVFSCCEFSDSGKAGGEYGVIPNGLGVDIEPDALTDVPTGNLLFTECMFANNSGAGLSPSAKDCLFKGCTFWGTTTWSILVGTNVGLAADKKTQVILRAPDSKRVIFEDCRIYGSCEVQFVDPRESPKFIRCYFEDLEDENGNVYRASLPFGACLMTNKGNVQLDGCLVVANKTRGLHLSEPTFSEQNHHVLSNCTILHKFADLPPLKLGTADGIQSEIDYALLINVHFQESINPQPATPWNIAVSALQIVDRVMVDGPSIVWKDRTVAGWSPVAPMLAIGNTQPLARASIRLNRIDEEADRFGPFDGYISVAASSLRPTWVGRPGDIVFNQGAAVGHHVGWVWLKPPLLSAVPLQPGWYPFGTVDQKDP